MLKTETKSVIMPKEAFTYTKGKTSANLLEWNTLCESIGKFRPPTKNRVVLVFLEKKKSQSTVWFGSALSKLLFLLILQLDKGQSDGKFCSTIPRIYRGKDG